MTQEKINKIAFWFGCIVGGGVFNISYSIIENQLPGAKEAGALGVIGWIVFGGPAWIILVLIQKHSEKKNTELLKQSESSMPMDQKSPIISNSLLLRMTFQKGLRSLALLMVQHSIHNPHQESCVNAKITIWL